MYNYCNIVYVSCYTDICTWLLVLGDFVVQFLGCRVDGGGPEYGDSG